MKILLLLALTTVPASIGFADSPAAAASPDADKIDPRLLDLEKELTHAQEVKGPDTASHEQYKAFIVKFRARLAETTAAMVSTPANQSVHARILVRLGDSTQALADLNGALKKDPNSLQLSTAKAYVLFDQKDYAGSAAAANAILAADPKNQDALWLKHASEDRNAPSVKLPGSPWGETPESQAGIVGRAAGVSGDSDKPYTLAIKVGATRPPPNYSASSGSPPPPEKSSPLVPLAATGVLLWVGASVAARRSQERAVESVERAAESVMDKASSLVEHRKELIEDHPYKSGALAVTGVAVGLLATPLILGGGGPTLLAAGASGGAVPLAASVAPQVIVAGGAATLALSVSGDQRGPTTNEKTNKSDVEPVEATESGDHETRKISSDQRQRINEVLKRVDADSQQPHRQDGTIYKNKGPGWLPEKPEAYYREYTVPQSNGARGIERLVVGAKGEICFSPDHYETFIRIR